MRGAPKKPAVRSPEERNLLVNEHLDLADNIVSHLWKKYPARMKRLGSDDALQAARMGLMRAADLWNGKTGTEFRIYAWRFCRGWVLLEMRRSMTVQCSSRHAVVHVQKLPLDGTTIEERQERPDPGLDTAHHRIEKVFESMPPGHEVNYLRRLAQGSLQYDAWKEEGFGCCPYSLHYRALRMARGENLDGSRKHSPFRERLNTIGKDKVASLLSLLPARMAENIKLFYLEDLSCKETAARTGTSSSAIQRSMRMALVLLESRAICCDGEPV